ncbi:MAG TPA: DUF2269 family protein [Gaiellaceae bacterium]
MTWYSFLLFVHVAMAVIWVGGGLMMQFFGIRAAMSGDPSRFATLGADIKWIADRVFIPASLLGFVSGILLVVESDFYGFGDDWIVIGLALYATTFLAGILVLGPESGRVGKLTAEGSPEAGPRMLRLLLLSRLDLVVLFAMIYTMTVKPDFGDAASILWGVAGAAVAAGLIYWRYRVALAQGPPPAPAWPS